MHKFYYIYKIICLKGSFAGHYYYGQHQTNNMNDRYAGSGQLLKNYYDKYGKIENQTYIKEIITFCNSVEELNIVEKEIIGDKFETDPLCMNLCEGGRGYIKKKSNKKRKGHVCSESCKQKIGEKNKGNKARLGMKTSEETKAKMKESAKYRPIVSEETRKKQSMNKKGRKWIIDPETNKRKWI